MFSRNAFTAPPAPKEELWTRLDHYVAEKAKVDEETRRLTALFGAALEIPAISAADSALDCPLCGTSETLTLERVAFIRDSVAQTESFRTAEAAALTALHDLQSKVDSFSTAAAAALPRFVKQIAGGRRKAGFTIARMRGLLDDQIADAVLLPWLRTLAPLYQAKRRLASHAAARRLWG